MWIDLTDAEAAAVVVAMREGSVVDKLSTRPAADTGAFLAAAERNGLPEVDVDGYGVADVGNSDRT
jgi:hypothetical protein